MTWMYRRFKQSVQVRLTVYFLIILLPLVTVSLLSNVQSKRNMEAQFAERTINGMESSLEYIDLIMQGFYDMSTTLATDPYLIRTFEEGAAVPTATDILQFQKASSQISSMTSVNKAINQAAVLHQPSGFLISNGAYRKINNRGEIPLLRKAVESNGNIVIVRPGEEKKDIQTIFGNDVDQNNIHLLRLMNFSDPQSKQNIVLMTVSSDYLKKLIEHLLPKGNAQVHLYDSQKRYIVGTGSSSPLNASDFDEENSHIWTKRQQMNGERQLFVKTTSAVSRWSLVMIQPEAEIFAWTRQVQRNTLLTIFISAIVAVWISWFVYSGISSPLTKLILGMKQFRQGQLDTAIQHKRKDEFGFLMDSFNLLTAEQRHLIQGIYEQQLRASQAELRLMQAQINPHFLYNTLDSIYSSAVISGVDDIGEMVYNLSKFMRISLGKGKKDRFTIEETFEHMLYYVKVQQIRFQDNLRVHVVMNPECSQLKLVKLLLQPLVENAIIHGVECKSGNSDIHVKCDLTPEGDVLLEVSDNGVGITPERLQYIQEQLQQVTVQNMPLIINEELSFADLFGLRNVKARLKLTYGEEADMWIESIWSEGTKVFIRIPKRLMV
ncbi:histidine kinase [Paenibacillus qinlingensis]|uniref:Two-component system sensor histidine kinase YesM n=1 Tax=Paenibacillus qinlingensis TaxID=1837343 RepID=A0ABU1NU72_9BACL|nr:histidine kinase [Paenibacillus qinlingensis]MDR6550879.1 two-component system sensor histidine kinase YesM [Paenibacillus qinlingensis]